MSNHVHVWLKAAVAVILGGGMPEYIKYKRCECGKVLF